MAKTKKFVVAGLFACLLLAAVCLLPAAQKTTARADGEGAVYTRNQNLVVRYDMGDIDGGKIKASSWDNATQKYVPYSAMDATVSGTITKTDGQEGAGAATYAASAYATSAGKLPLGSSTTGITVSYWIKNASDDWAGVVELYDGSNGARFGKATIQLNGGTARAWTNNFWPDISKKLSNGGNWDSFISNSNDHFDDMQPDTWYQVTVTVTTGAMHMYRNGSKKITYDTGSNDKGTTVGTALTSIMNAVKSGNAYLQLNGFFGSTNSTDTVDDIRIYDGAMSDSDVLALYNEYGAIASLNKKTLKTNDPTLGNSAVAINNITGANVGVANASNAFPELYIGGVTAVEKSADTNPVYSASGEGFGYSYVITNDTQSSPATATETATVTYVENGQEIVFNVTCTALAAFLNNIHYKIDDGAEQAVAGFAANKESYTIALSAANFKFEFVEKEADKGNADFTVTYPATINYNGDNQIVVSNGTDPTTYTVTLSRPRADVEPAVKGFCLEKTTQHVYTDDLSASVTENDVTLKYPNSTETKNFVWNGTTHTATFTVRDKTLDQETAYTVVFKSKEEGRVAYWNLDETSGSTFAGQKWDATQGKYVSDSNLTMTSRKGSGAGKAPLEDKTATAPTFINGKLGKAIELPAWGFTTANMPTANANGFTFSAWVKFSGIAYEPIFAVYHGTKGAIIEKGNMQTVTNVNNDGTGNYSNVDGGSVVGGGSVTNALMNTSSFTMITVTVSYVQGSGVIKFYKDGNLLVVYQDRADVDNMASIVIDALNEGGKFGLHRHFYDCAQTSAYDDVRLYAYEMSEEDVSALYGAYSAVTPQVAPVAATGITGADIYPDIVIGGATVVTDGALKKGTTTDGIVYTYTPLSGPVSKATDVVPVTFSKMGIYNTVNVLYNRTFTPPTITALQYKIGGTAQADPITFASGVTEASAKVAANVDLTAANQITGDTATFVTLDGDSDTANYHADLTYDNTTKDATVKVYYKDYDNIATTYTVHFENKSTDTSVTSLSITGVKGGGTLSLGNDDFTGTAGARVSKVGVDNLASFTLVLTFELPAGATLQSHDPDHADRITFTQADLVDTDKLKFTVVSENGSANQEEYTLSLSTLSSDAKLSALQIEGYTLSPTFSALVQNYTIQVETGTDCTALPNKVTATVNDSEAQTPVVAYNEAEQKITITVTAEDGTVLVYTVALQFISTDATLSEIKIGGTLLAGFAAGTTEYVVKFPVSVDALGEVTVKTTSQDAAYQIGELSANNELTVTVTAQNGATKTYKLTFVKMSADKSLSSLTVGGTALTFKKGSNTVVYKVDQGTDVTSLQVVAMPTNADAAVTYAADAAENVITVTVTAENGSTAVYIVRLEFNESAPAKKDGCGSAVAAETSAIVALLMLALATVVVRRKKGAKN